MENPTAAGRLAKELYSLFISLGFSKAESQEALDLLLSESVSGSASPSEEWQGIYSRRVAHLLARKKLGAGAHENEIKALSDHYYMIIVAVFTGIGSNIVFGGLSSLASGAEDLALKSVPRVEAGTQPEARHDEEVHQQRILSSQGSHLCIQFHYLPLGPALEHLLSAEAPSVRTSSVIAEDRSLITKYGLVALVARWIADPIRVRDNYLFVARQRTARVLLDSTLSGIDDTYEVVNEMEFKREFRLIAVNGKAGVDDFGVQKSPHEPYSWSDVVVSRRGYEFLVAADVRFRRLSTWPERKTLQYERPEI